MTNIKQHSSTWGWRVSICFCGPGPLLSPRARSGSGPRLVAARAQAVDVRGCILGGSQEGLGLLLAADHGGPRLLWVVVVDPAGHARAGQGICLGAVLCLPTRSCLCPPKLCLLACCELQQGWHAPCQCPCSGQAARRAVLMAAEDGT